MKKLGIAMVLLVLVSLCGFSQSVTGVVYLADQPVKNARVKSLDNGSETKTDVNGYFELNTTFDAELEVIYKGVKVTRSLNGIDAYADIVLIPSEKKFQKLILSSPSIKSCELFITQYPESKYISQIQLMLEEQHFISAYDNAVGNFKQEGLLNYLALYPSGRFASKALKTIDILSWQKAKSKDTMEAYNDYMVRFPDGEAVSLARKRVASLTE